MIAAFGMIKVKGVTEYVFCETGKFISKGIISGHYDYIGGIIMV